MDEINRQGSFFQPSHQLLKFSGQVRESLPARLIRFTARKQQIHGALGIRGNFQTKCFILGHDAIQDDRAYALGVHFQIRQGGPTAVGQTIQVYFFVAQGLANIVQVLHGQRGRIQGRVSVQVGQAGAQPLFHCSPIRSFFPARFRAVRAVQGIGLTRAALVHQDDSALLADALKGASQGDETFGCRLARPTGEEEQRVGFGAATDRR